MKRILFVLCMAMVTAGFAASGHAAEEVANMIIPAVNAVEPVAAAEKVAAPAVAAKTPEPTSAQVKSAVEEYVKGEMAEAGVFDVYDPDKEETRELGFDSVHDQTGKTGEYYYACADFTDKNSNEKLDLDFDVENADGQLNVVDVRIHKVSGVPRFTYDEQNNRIPVAGNAADEKMGTGDEGVKPGEPKDKAGEGIPAAANAAVDAMPKMMGNMQMPGPTEPATK